MALSHRAAYFLIPGRKRQTINLCAEKKFDYSPICLQRYGSDLQDEKPKESNRPPETIAWLLWYNIFR
jgi:hypothetical protein